jgi:hypothetical protein
VDFTRVFRGFLGKTTPFSSVKQLERHRAVSILCPLRLDKFNPTSSVSAPVLTGTSDSLTPEGGKRPERCCRYFRRASPKARLDEHRRSIWRSHALLQASRLVYTIERSKVCGMAVSGMPTPLSRTEMRASDPATSSETSICLLAGVSLRALSKRNPHRPSETRRVTHIRARSGWCFRRPSGQSGPALSITRQLGSTSENG